jgi:acyl-CoA thioester hydrolase
MEFIQGVKIQKYTVEIRPRYAETDQGGVVHHSVYPVWFEIGRTELLRANGLVYKELESIGVFFVMARLQIKYRQPARYDELLELETVCTKVSICKIEHEYVLRRIADGVVLAEGASTLACIDKFGKVQRIPEYMYPAER